MLTNQVSIDRITVSGELKAEYRELQRVMNALGSSWELSDGVFRLIREYPNGDTENVAYYTENAFQAGSWRLDFNPNKLSDEEKLEMKRAIDLLTDVHFTRLDLAFDVFNNEVGMKYRIYRQASHSANMAFIRHNGPKPWRRYITVLTVPSNKFGNITS